MGKARDLARLSPDSSGRIALPSGVSGVLPDANAPSGSVIQVVQTVKTDGFSTSSGSSTDITGLSATITPSSTSNKILVLVNFYCASGDYPYPKFRLLRNGANIFLGDSLGGATQASAGMYPGAASDIQIMPVSMSFVDSPSSVAALTYKVTVFTYASRTVYIGRSQNTGDSNGLSVPSTITLLEVVA